MSRYLLLAADEDDAYAYLARRRERFGFPWMSAHGGPIHTVAICWPGALDRVSGEMFDRLLVTAKAHVHPVGGIVAQACRTRIVRAVDAT